MNTEEKSSYIREKRQGIGLTQSEFARLLGLRADGERTVRGWELGEHSPSDAKWRQIKELDSNPPFRQSVKKKYPFRFIDLFAGIGGIRIPFQEAGGLCVFTSEWDRFAQKTYAANFGHLPDGDITKINPEQIPDHDFLLGGFPCQAFSQAGLKKGFHDSRGTLFFEIQKILVAKKPKAFLLENVKQLRGHDKGRTLQTVINILEGNSRQEIDENIEISAEARQALCGRLNYHVFTKVLRAGDFGVPQNRERIFIIGFDRNYFGDDIKFDRLFNWPKPPKQSTRLGDILETSSQIDEKYTISEKLWRGHIKRKKAHIKKGNGFGYTLFNEDSEYTNTLSARYYKDGSEILIDQSHMGKTPRKLTPRECARLQGFPDEFIVDAVSANQAYKQFGNSVAVPVVRAVTSEILAAIKKGEKMKSEGKTHQGDYIPDLQGAQGILGI